MPKNTRSQEDIRQWIGYTDILASSLLVLMLVAILASINNASNQKPPLIKLTEARSFRFETGSFELTPEFRSGIDSLIPIIINNTKKYNIDTIEVIGHTDGQPSSGTSNLDFNLSGSWNRSNFQNKRLIPGSNVDLGLLRALSVASYIRTTLKNKGLDPPEILPYSAGSLVDTEGNVFPADTSSRSERRRIEIRFTRFKQ